MTTHKDIEEMCKCDGLPRNACPIHAKEWTLNWKALLQKRLEDNGDSSLRQVNTILFVEKIFKLKENEMIERLESKLITQDFIIPISQEVGHNQAIKDAQTIIKDVMKG